MIKYFACCISCILSISGHSYAIIEPPEEQAKKVYYLESADIQKCVHNASRAVDNVYDKFTIPADTLPLRIDIAAHFYHIVVHDKEQAITAHGIVNMSWTDDKLSCDEKLAGKVSYVRSYHLWRPVFLAWNTALRGHDKGVARRFAAEYWIYAKNWFAMLIPSVRMKFFVFNILSTMSITLFRLAFGHKHTEPPDDRLKRIVDFFGGLPILGKMMGVTEGTTDETAAPPSNASNPISESKPSTSQLDSGVENNELIGAESEEVQGAKVVGDSFDYWVPIGRLVYSVFAILAIIGYGIFSAMWLY